jgi:hypothetical protein
VRIGTGLAPLRYTCWNMFLKVGLLKETKEGGKKKRKTKSE